MIYTRFLYVYARYTIYPIKPNDENDAWFAYHFWLSLGNEDQC